MDGVRYRFILKYPVIKCCPRIMTQLKKCDLILARLSSYGKPADILAMEHDAFCKATQMARIGKPVEGVNSSLTLVPVHKHESV